MSLNDIISKGLGDLANPIINTQAKEFDPILSLHKQVDYKRQHLYILVWDGIPAFLVNSIDKPTLSLGDPKIAKYPNTYEKMQQGSGMWNDISIILNDPIEISASKKIYDFIKKQWNYIEAYSAYPADYIIDSIELRLLDGNGLVVETWVLYNCFLSGDINFNMSQLSYDENNIQKIKINISYSYAELISGGY